ncbi:Protein of unknown function [Propionibacterium freudenreichii]|nr:Protein of unknown function [Propionibacterium freudenreichii]
MSLQVTALDARAGG